MPPLLPLPFEFSDKITQCYIVSHVRVRIAEMKDDRKDMMACQEAMEANLKKMEPNPEMRRSIAEHWEIPAEETALK
jgi:rRNA maturation endonuclease Nob1